MALLSFSDRVKGADTATTAWGGSIVSRPRAGHMATWVDLARLSPSVVMPHGRFGGGTPEEVDLAQTVLAPKRDRQNNVWSALMRRTRCSERL
jgi:hypothetical protein